MQNKILILAKPSGITLEGHRYNVVQEGFALAQKLPATKLKYDRFCGAKKSSTESEFVKRLEKVCFHHDDGKESNHKWQEACQKDYQSFLTWKKENPEKSFKQYEQEKGKEVGENIRKAQVRHEMSLAEYFNKDDESLLWGQVAIMAHHGKLSQKDERLWANVGPESQISLTIKQKGPSSKKENIDKVAKQHYIYSGIRSYLQLADHRASAKEAGEKVLNLSSFEYTFPPLWEKREVQKIVEENWEKDFLLLRAPTGAGKTDASLLWASQQIRNKRADRLVVAMPTRFTSNALAINLSKNLCDVGLYHSSSWFSSIQPQIDSESISSEEGRVWQGMARTLCFPATVCTIDHLLMALTLSREDHHQISFNLANSCVVIDEVDFYDTFTLANLCTLLRLLKAWEVPILMMSASLPNNMVKKFQDVFDHKAVKLLEDKSDYERIRFRVEQIVEQNEITDTEEILQLIINQGSGIVYANTVDRALEYYNWFADHGVELDKIFLYHSRFTEPDKQRKEETLLRHLGREAWATGTASGIAILTQIGEISVNISADIMISDICPIDRLMQRTGRLCRFETNKQGMLYIVVPQKNGMLYPAPYGVFRNKEWIPAEAFQQSVKKLTIAKTFPQEYSVNKLLELVNSVYSGDIKFSDEEKNNAETLLRFFKQRLFVLPETRSKEDEIESSDWKARSLSPQKTIYIREPEKEYFSTYSSFTKWGISCSIDIPIYLYQKAQKKHIIREKPIFIGAEHEFNIGILLEGNYSFETGIDLNEPDIFL